MTDLYISVLYLFEESLNLILIFIILPRLNEKLFGFIKYNLNFF